MLPLLFSLLLTPCTTASRCTEIVPMARSEKSAKVYRNYPLNEKNAAIERALIVIHGASRDAHNYFASALAGALIAGTLESSMIIAPRFGSNKGAGCRDTLDPDEISWTCGGGEDWRGGGAAEATAGGVTTFDLIDDLVRKVARKEVFPNLRAIVVTGHSAGGQFVSRYVAASRVE